MNNKNCKDKISLNLHFNLKDVILINFNRKINLLLIKHKASQKDH